MFNYGRMKKKILSQLVYASTACCLGFKSLLGWDFFSDQVVYVIMKIVTSCFNRLSLLSRSLVGYILENIPLMICYCVLNIIITHVHVTS